MLWKCRAIGLNRVLELSPTKSPNRLKFFPTQQCRPHFNKHILYVYKYFFMLGILYHRATFIVYLFDK